MSELTLGKTLRAALIAGLAAGLAAALFHTVATEPIIEQAIALETAHQGGQEHTVEIVSRGMQRIGLWLGFLVYGLALSLVFGVAYHSLRERLSRFSPPGAAALLAGLSYWSLGLLPALKYPAAPPGVGDPDTIAYRQTLFLGYMAATIAATALSTVAGLSLAKPRSDMARYGLTAGLLVLSAAALYLLFPANPDAVTLPPELIGPFRVLSLVGLTLFWAIFGLVLALQLRPPQTQPAAFPRRNAPSLCPPVI